MKSRSSTVVSPSEARISVGIPLGVVASDVRLLDAVKAAAGIRAPSDQCNVVGPTTSSPAVRPGSSSCEAQNICTASSTLTRWVG